MPIAIQLHKGDADGRDAGRLSEPSGEGMYHEEMKNRAPGWLSQ